MKHYVVTRNGIYVGEIYAYCACDAIDWYRPERERTPSVWFAVTGGKA